MTSENIKIKRKEDALDLAYLIYDIFKESDTYDKSVEGAEGQNNADHIKDD